MNNRLNIQDLAGLLSERTGKDRGEVERFLRDFISVVSGRGLPTNRDTCREVREISLF